MIDVKHALQVTSNLIPGSWRVGGPSETTITLDVTDFRELCETALALEYYSGKHEKENKKLREQLKKAREALIMCDEVADAKDLHLMKIVTDGTIKEIDESKLLEGDEK